MDTFQLAVIGGGPAGYSGAIHAAKKGIKVILIEQGEIGGTCLNRGCIPSKILLEAASQVHKPKYYIRDMSIDQEKLFQHRSSTIKKLRNGIEYLLKRNKITVLRGSASLAGDHLIEVQTSQGMQFVEAEHILVATGSRPREWKEFEFESDFVITSDQATQTVDIPESITILGGGAVGVEFSYIYQALGSQVTLVEMMERILPGEDHDISQALKEKLESLGIQVITGKKIVESYIENDRVAVVLENSQKISSHKIMSSIGRLPNIEALGIEKYGVEIGNRSEIVVNDFLQTKIPHIYAVGDVTGRVMLAHAAASQAITAIENMFGSGPEKWNGTYIPRCVYTSPEVASVGLTEEQANLQYKDIKVEIMPFMANGKAVATGEEEGFIKVIADQNSRLLGIHIFGPRATDMISQGSLYLSYEFDVQKVAQQIYPHPTYSEAIYEAILNLEGKAIHI